MRLQKGLLIGIFASAAVIGCGENEKNQVKTTQEQETTQTQQPRTYAEIAVKSGGSWEGTKYNGGLFENVDQMEVPASHSDHSGYIKYEGPGWENSQVGYRLYLDWRNAIDIFGKKTDSMILDGVGREDAPSYHDEADWGMDILKAGQSMGLGGFGRYMGDSVAHFEDVENTRVRVNNADDSSTVHIQYTKWKTGDDATDLSATFTITPEGRHTKVELSPSEPVDNLATGIVKFDDIDVMQKESQSGDWGYIATYGTQTLVNDQDLLGMAVFYNTNEVAQVKEGPHDHLVIFKPEDEITYYFSAAWEQELNGVTSEEEFMTYLEQQLRKLDEEGEL